jgi:hypothetical protein
MELLSLQMKIRDNYDPLKNFEAQNTLDDLPVIEIAGTSREKDLLNEGFHFGE